MNFIPAPASRHKSLALVTGSLRTAGYRVSPWDENNWELIKALGGTKSNAAKKLLAELLGATPLEVELNERGRPASQHEYQQAQLFNAFVVAATELNGGQPVLEKAEVEAALFQVSKGTTPEMEAHNRAVPAARRAAVGKLREFYGTRKN